MQGLGLKPRNANGASVLPEIAAADNFDASARVAGPAPSPGLGLAKPAAIPDPSSQAVEPPPVPSAIPPEATQAAPAPRQTARERVQWKNNPLAAIGLILSNVSAGMRGDPLPIDQLAKQDIEEQAMAYKSAELGMNVIEAATKQLKGRPASEHGAIIEDFDKRFSAALGGMSIKPMLEAISSGQIKDAGKKLELGKQLGIFTPQILSYYENDPDGLDKLLTTVMAHKATQQTPEEIAANAAATAAGTKAGGKTPAELAADAAATAGATQKPPAQIEAEAAATARGTKAGNPDKTPAQIEAEAAARARGEAAGSGAGDKMTDTQATSALYADRASQAETDLAEVAHVGTNFWQHLRAGTGGNYATSSEFQRFDQARRNFITAVLRKESGAVIGADEMKQADEQYFPQPGNDDKVIAQKAKNRATAIEGLKRAAGPAYGKAKPDPLGIR